MRRLAILLLLISGVCSAADFNFIRVGGKYYLASKAADGSLVTREVSVAFLDVDGVVVPTPPGPGPGPAVPEGWNGLTKIVYASALKIPVAARAEKAKLLGDNFEAIASGLSAGQFADINAANAELKTKNQAAVGTATDVWLPVLKDEANAMQVLFAAGKFTGLPDYAAAYKAVADGFRLAAAAN